MESSENGSDILYEFFYPLNFTVYRDGRVARAEVTCPIPPSLDPRTGVESKDIEIFPERGVSVRIFKPSTINEINSVESMMKLPVVVYFHGGYFCIQSTFSATYHPYLNSLASQARALVVSVEYRLAPEHPLPAAYDDCWDALNWVVSHATNGSSLGSRGCSNDQEPWLRDNADFSRIFLAGDCAGGNIAHHVALRVGNQGLASGSIFRISGIVLSHPCFWGKDRFGYEIIKLRYSDNPQIVDQIWHAVCPGTSGSDDPWINPARDPDLSNLGCERALIFIAEEDIFRHRGVYYKECLERSGWQGIVELEESHEEDHVLPFG